MKNAPKKLDLAPEGVVCDDVSCSVGPAPARAAESRGQAASQTLEIEVYSDWVCPWCPVGERRLEKALELLGPAVQAKVTFRPYELNPGLPREGVDRRAYLAAKFGSLATYEAMSARVVAAAKSEGLDFRMERIEKASNTRDAHRLAWLAEKQGRQPALVEVLFRAYFTEGKNLGDHGVLRACAAEAGLDAARVDALLASDEGLTQVLALEERAFRLGIQGVPAFVVGGEPILSGAQPPEVIAAALRAKLA